MTATKTQTPTTTDLDLEALRVDGERRLEELREQRQRISVEALVDAQVASELEDVESAIEATSAELRRIELAGTEQERRDREAAEAAEYERVEAHMRRARELQPEIEKVIATYDRKLGEAMVALRAFCDLTLEQQQELGAAGERPPRTPPWAANASLAFAMNHAGLSRGLIVLESVTGKPRPLAELHPTPALGEQ
jgi:hypothetical protein